MPKQPLSAKSQPFVFGMAMDTPTLADAVKSEATVFRPSPPAGPVNTLIGSADTSRVRALLDQAAELTKKGDVYRLLLKAKTAFEKGDWAEGGEFALKALHLDEKIAAAWHMLALSRDKQYDFGSAISCYEAALKLEPENHRLAGDIGRMAYNMNMMDMAEQFFVHYLNHFPDSIEAINNIVTVLSERSAYVEAIDILKEALGRHPESAQLWNALGTIMNAQGDLVNSTIFYSEALRHEPGFAMARYNLGNVKAAMGHPQEALGDLMAALPLFMEPANIQTCRLSIAMCYLNMGDLVNGWLWYESRNDIALGMQYLIDRPRFDRLSDVRGRKLFISAEQGVGDEILFASLIADLIEDIGPDGHLTLGVEPRLVPIFRRAFPKASVTRHHTTKYNGVMVRVYPEVEDWTQYEAWGVFGDFLGRYRSHVEDFPASNVFLKPDPERVAYWKAVLNGVNARPKVGILWKSLIQNSRRDRYFSPFGQWEHILRTPGVQFVNLQYGDTSAEMEAAKELGLDLWTPPDIDLKMDLEDLSALCKAMDLLICPSNATSNIAAAVGTPVWIVSNPNSWITLGTDRLPWYPAARVFMSESYLDWAPVMGSVQRALETEFTSVTARVSA